MELLHKPIMTLNNINDLDTINSIKSNIQDRTKIPINIIISNTRVTSYISTILNPYDLHQLFNFILSDKPE